MRRAPHITVITILVGLGLGLLTLPASAASSSSPDCTATSPDHSLTLSSPTGTGSTLTAGTNIDLLASWTAPAWAEKATLSICVTTNGVPYPGPPTQFPVVSEDGSFTAPLAVPADLAPGTDICVVGVLSGHHSDATPATETSNQLCFRTAAVAPTSTTTTTTVTTAMAPTTMTTTTMTIGVSVAGATPPSAPATLVQAKATPAPSPRPELPRTGGSIDVLSALAAAAIAGGSVLRLLGQRHGAHRPVSSGRSGVGGGD